jgi:hypothetical protein
MDELEDIVVLTWRFSPPDYFEGAIYIKRDDYVISIDNGTAEARISPETYDKDQGIRDRLTAALHDRFMGAQLFSHKQYELSKASMYRLHPDGRKDITVFAEPIAIRSTFNAGDIIVKDKYGNVIIDSRQERIQKKQVLAELAEKYRQKDPFFASMLKSYNDAVNDPGNELVHLYEIRDSIVKHFGGKSKAQNVLGITQRQWSIFGNLANDEPLKQGRHRGKNPGVLRDATEEELRVARSVARELVEAYLNYLEGSC